MPTHYIKTDTGVDEVHNKGHKLPSKLRTMLILIDGSKSTEALREQAIKIGVKGDFLKVLEDLGLIARVMEGQEIVRKSIVASHSSQSSTLEDSAHLFLEVQKFMNVTAVNSSPMRAFLFTLKLEKCSTIDDLEALLDDYQALITKGSGEEEAEVLVEKVSELLKH